MTLNPMRHIFLMILIVFKNNLELKNYTNYILQKEQNQSTICDTN